MGNQAAELGPELEIAHNEDFHVPLTRFTPESPGLHLAEVASALSPGARVLVLGLDQNASALYLAQRGLQVHAFDIKSARISSLNREAMLRGVYIEAHTIEADLSRIPLEGLYDLIVVNEIETLVSPGHILPLAGHLKNHSREGCIHLYSNQMYGLAYPEPLHQRHSGGSAHRLERGDLEQCYIGWETLCSDYYVLWNEEKAGVSQRFEEGHPIEKLIFRKPSPQERQWKKNTLCVPQDTLSMEKFFSIRLGAIADQIMLKLGFPSHSYSAVFENSFVRATDSESGAYSVQCMLYGRTGFQISQGRVHSRVMYFSDPCRIKFLNAELQT